jgi:hypothetical protein
MDKNPSNAAFALLERYAANIIELNCDPQRQCDAADNLLTRCTRLEVLMNVQRYAPAAWLHLSQLHTLHGANLSVVSMAAIAAALPRLHTLGVLSPTGVPAAAVAGFFEDLLPRLQSFQYVGNWPQNLHTDSAAPSRESLPLPQLRILSLLGDDSLPWTGFLGARPLKLAIDDVVIRRWLLANRNDDAAAAVTGGVTFRPLASVRTLMVYAGSQNVLTPTYVARLLRAAPQLKLLFVSASEVAVDFSWLADPDFDDDLVHLKLKYIRVSGLGTSTPLTTDSLTRLQQRHFPRLQSVGIAGRDYSVAPLDSPSSLLNTSSTASCDP